MKTCFRKMLKILQEDLEDAVSPDTQVVIIDARAINNIDITAADRLAELSSRLTDPFGIHFISLNILKN